MLDVGMPLYARTAIVVFIDLYLLTVYRLPSHARLLTRWFLLFLIRLKTTLL
jgi:hypothetical protein